MFSLSSQGGFTPLIGAAQEGHSEVVSFLLDSGAHVESATEVSCMELLSMLWDDVVFEELSWQPRIRLFNALYCMYLCC